GTRIWAEKFANRRTGTGEYRRPTSRVAAGTSSRTPGPGWWQLTSDTASRSPPRRTVGPGILAALLLPFGLVAAAAPLDRKDAAGGGIQKPVGQPQRCCAFRTVRRLARLRRQPLLVVVVCHHLLRLRAG